MAGPVSPTSNVNFFSPSSILAPDLAVQQMQNDRAQQLAMALRQMSLEPIDAGKGAVSWTQGAAKLADALAARAGFQRTDKQQMALNQQFGARMGSMFGGAQAPAMPKGGGQSSPPDPPQAGTAPLSTAPGNPYQPSPSQAPPQPIQSVNPDAAAAAPMSAQQAPAPQQAPVSPAGPMSLSGDPQGDMARYAMNPEEYTKAVIAAHAPTDFNKLLQQSGIDPNSPLGKQIMQAQIAKQNYVAPINGRPGATIRDPNDPSRVLGYDAPTLEGAFPTYGPNGMPTGYQTAPGAVEAQSAMAAGKAGATAAAQAPYELVTVTDANGRTFQIPKSAVPGVGGPSGPGAPAGGSLNTFYSHGGPQASPGVTAGPGGIGVQTGIGPGAQSAGATSGTNSANGFNQAIQGGVNAKNAMFTINNITKAAEGLPTGTGSGMISEIKSGANAVLGSAGIGPVFDTANIAKFDEMKKNAAMLGEQLSGAATGGGGTDARLKNALDSLPGAHYSPAAIQEVGTNLKSLQAAALARSQAASSWMQQHGPDSFPAFQSAWQQAYNPDIFYHMQKGDVAQWSHGMSVGDRNNVLSQYRQLKALGGI